jgi:hypothetical protein
MRRLILSAFAVIGLMTAPAAALAAPTCIDKDGGAIRCGVDGALPVGTPLSAQQIADRRVSVQADPTPIELFGLISLLIAFFGLIAVMPDFDGRKGSDWGEQEGDGEEQG